MRLVIVVCAKADRAPVEAMLGDGAVSADGRKYVWGAWLDGVTFRARDALALRDIPNVYVREQTGETGDIAAREDWKALAGYAGREG